MHKTFIPKRFFYDCKIVKKAQKWVNSRQVKENIEENFKGAVFNLGRKDISMLSEQGINLTLDTKKIYCYRDIKLRETIKFEENEYIVITGREYLKHDELRIYYIQRLGK